MNGHLRKTQKVKAFIIIVNTNCEIYNNCGGLTEVHGYCGAGIASDYIL